MKRKRILLVWVALITVGVFLAAILLRSEPENPVRGKVLAGSGWQSFRHSRLD